MAIEKHQVNFELVPLEKLVINFTEMVEDHRYKLSRARSPKAKRDNQNTINLIASTAYYLQELSKKNETT